VGLFALIECDSRGDGSASAARIESIRWARSVWHSLRIFQYLRYRLVQAGGRLELVPVVDELDDVALPRIVACRRRVAPSRLEQPFDSA
jgi:hypothetical protein